MEELPNQNQPPENSTEDIHNFHEVSERRKELRKAIGELGNNGTVFEKHYKGEKESLDRKASGFKVADFKDKENPSPEDSGLKGAKKLLENRKLNMKKLL
jgi:hypothetical protein